MTFSDVAIFARFPYVSSTVVSKRIESLGFSRELAAEMS